MADKIVIDTNLLFLLIAGTANVEYIGKLKRLQSFNESHFGVLVSILNGYSQVVVTPHSLAELWNLIGEDRRGWSDARGHLFEVTKSYIESFLEIHRPAKDLTQRPELRWLGLSDVSQLVVAEEAGFALVSRDGLLCREAMERGIETQPFWQIAEQF